VFTWSSTYFEEAPPTFGAHLIEMCTCGMPIVILLLYDLTTLSWWIMLVYAFLG